MKLVLKVVVLVLALMACIALKVAVLLIQHMVILFLPRRRPLSRGSLEPAGRSDAQGRITPGASADTDVSKDDVRRVLRSALVRPNRK